MRKRILIITIACSVLGLVYAKDNKPKIPVPVVPVKILTNDVDSMSYALGMNVGMDFAKNLKGIPGGKSNIELLIKGFSATMKGDSTLLNAEVATEFFKNYIAKAQKIDTDAKKLANEKYLAENKTKEGFKSTASGLQYQILVAKDGPKPAAIDTVKVHYTGYLIDGTKFDSSVDRGEPISFPLNQVIPGWTEGVQLISVGSKYKFVIPYTLGYGEQGAGNGAIPGFATLIFEVELLGINPFKEAPVVEVKAVEKPKVIKKITTAKKKLKK